MNPQSAKKRLAVFFTLISVPIALTIYSRTTSAIAHHHLGGMPHHQQSPTHNSHHEMSMTLGPADGEYDLRFIDSMILHHQGAVNMAEVVLQNSQRPEMKKLAQAIIEAQEQEIAQMKAWRKSWYAKASDQPLMWHTKMNHSTAMNPEQTQAMMMHMDLGKGDTEFDLRFIDAMIPHHEGALVMAKDALSKSQRAEIQELSQAILASQQQEIEQMKQWRKDWYQR
ncbi:MAG: DUF305 domain-containing protein [Snowella sp.]|nr:DUF305 domain-containing protein [Snowella sp.]